MNPIRILLADDHALVRAGIRALLQQIPGVEVIAEADDGRAALELIEQTHPDIALLDIAMPVMNGLETATRIREKFPTVHVVILSMHVEKEYVLQALRVGAAGYLLKGARTAELEIAILAVARGESYLSPAASKQLVGDVLHRTQEGSDPLACLTPRQRQVLELIARGRSRKQIAKDLAVSAKTVDTYRAQVMEQLQIRDTAGLVRFAIKMGLVEVDSRPAE